MTVGRPLRLLKTGHSGVPRLGGGLGRSVPTLGATRNHPWPLSISCTCTCTRPIRCWKARLTIARLAELAKADKQPALALTDTDNMFGALEFSEKLSSAGIQPIVGCALAIDFGDTDHGARNANARPRASASCCWPRARPAIAA